MPMTDTNVTLTSPPHRPRQPDALSRAGGRAAAMACRHLRNPARRRPLHVLHRPRGLPAGLHRAHHVHPCALRLAVDDVLGRHGARRARHADLASPAGRCRGQGGRAHRRGVHVSGASHRLALGQADVGNLLGLGRAAHVRLRAVPHVSRRHCADPRHRGCGPVRPRRRDPHSGRSCQSADHQILGELVEHAAPARRRVPHGRADHPSRSALAARHYGAGVHTACSSRCIIAAMRNEIWSRRIAAMRRIAARQAGT